MDYKMEVEFLGNKRLGVTFTAKLSYGELVGHRNLSYQVFKALWDNSYLPGILEGFNLYITKKVVIQDESNLEEIKNTFYQAVTEDVKKMEATLDQAKFILDLVKSL